MNQTLTLKDFEKKNETILNNKDY